MTARPPPLRHLSQGPGLAKTRGYPLVATRHALLARTTDARWRSLFDIADVVSEGAPRAEGSGRVWYGSTSVILPHPVASDDERAFLERVLSRDLHVRTRALRIAHREAAVRAPSRLGMATCEVRFQVGSSSVRIDVDVQAPLIGEHASAL